jgi:hypothetical protein
LSYKRLGYTPLHRGQKKEKAQAYTGNGRLEQYNLIHP